MICYRTSGRTARGIVPSALPLDGFSPEHQAWIRALITERDRRICFVLTNPPPEANVIARAMADAAMEAKPGGLERLAAFKAEFAKMPAHIKDRLTDRAVDVAHAEGIYHFDGEAMQRELPNVPHVAEVFGVLHRCVIQAQDTFIELAISRTEVEYVLNIAGVLTGGRQGMPHPNRS